MNKTSHKKIFLFTQNFTAECHLARFLCVWMPERCTLQSECWVRSKMHTYYFFLLCTGDLCHGQTAQTYKGRVSSHRDWSQHGNTQEHLTLRSDCSGPSKLDYTYNKGIYHQLYCERILTNVVTEWLTFLLLIPEVLGSNVVPEAG
jgi:hypothetical protein